MRVFRNLSKGQILEQFESLQRESKHFNEMNEGGEVLSITVRWIGASTDFSQGDNTSSNVDGKVMSFTSEFGEQSFDKYAITFDGRVINMGAYCLRLANDLFTHVVLFQDNTKTNRFPEDQIKTDETSNEIELDEHVGIGRFCSYFGHSKNAF